MKLIRQFDRRISNIAVAVGVLLAVVLPGVLPVVASAAQLTSRSIALSTSLAAASGVSYTVKFTPIANAGAFILDFCNDSPVPGQACTPPVGFSVSGIGTSTAGATVTDDNTGTDSRVKVVYAMTAGTPVTVVLTGIHNPTNATAGTSGFYARIVTFLASSDTSTYSATNASGGTNVVDMGGAAMAITNSIAVTAAVRESMTFCVSAAAPTANCGGVTNPNVNLGTGTPPALTATAFSTGDVYSQVSTNAVSGAIVYMKTDKTCGGLSRASAPTTCDIAPATTPDTALNLKGQAKFGLLLHSATDATGATVTPSGTLVPSGSYTAVSNYFMDYVAGNATGVGSTYGSPVFNSSSAPVDNKNIQMTFGASITNTTPAGLYTANLNLIAVGTF